MKSEVTIVVTTWNSVSILKMFTEYLQKYTTVPYKLIVIDNGSTDSTISFLQNLDVLLIRNYQNVGVVKALAQAEKLVETKYIVAANDDILVSPYWLENLIEVYESDGAIKIAAPFKQGSKVRYPYSDKSSRDVWDSIKKDNPNKSPQELIELFCEGKTYEKFVEDIKAANNIGFELLTSPPDFLPGCCVLVETEFIQSIGGLVDTRFEYYGCEDVDRCWRVGKAGYKVVRTSRSYVHHFEGVSVAKNKLAWKKIMLENNCRLVEKWGEEFWGIFRQELTDSGTIPQLIKNHWIYSWLLESLKADEIPKDLAKDINVYLSNTRPNLK